MRRMSGPTATSRRALAAVLALTAALAFAGSKRPEPAPRFTSKTMDGQVSNESVKGKVVLFQFWTTWCQVCRGEQELVDQIDKEFAPKGLVVLAVDVGESKKTVKKFLEKNPRTVRIVLNDDTNLAAMYAATQYPIYVVIDREGNIAAMQRGGSGANGLRRLLSRAGLESEEE
jgi:thiol-disulfide isomerase/thioredoxin